jgi:hypothetical protein
MNSTPRPIPARISDTTIQSGGTGKKAIVPRNHSSFYLSKFEETIRQAEYLISPESHVEVPDTNGIFRAWIKKEREALKNRLHFRPNFKVLYERLMKCGDEITHYTLLRNLMGYRREMKLILGERFTSQRPEHKR